MTNFQKIEENNIFLRDMLQQVANWILIEHNLVDFSSAEPNSETPEEMLEKINNAITKNVFQPENQLNLFDSEEKDQPVIDVILIESTLELINKRIESNKNHIHSITKDSLVFNLTNAEEMLKELIVDLKKASIKRS